MILSICICSFLFAVTLRIVAASRQKVQQTRRSSSQACKTSIFLGSGGHTSEMLSLLSQVDFQRYNPRTYIISEGDSLSAQKAQELERRRSSLVDDYRIVYVPRARRVHQSLLSTPPTALWSLLVCLHHSTLSGQLKSDLLILNGPGTCFILCVALRLKKILGFEAPHIIYIESFARVHTLSLSGKLLIRFVDRFVVQWPKLALKESRGECRGWLI